MVLSGQCTLVLVESPQGAATGNNMDIRTRYQIRQTEWTKVGMSRWTWVTTAGVLLHTKRFGNGNVMANKKGGCVGGGSVPE
jgi:hypothetical protein